jgi:hypothetical protein
MFPGPEEHGAEQSRDVDDYLRHAQACMRVQSHVVGDGKVSIEEKGRK